MQNQNKRKSRKKNVEKCYYFYIFKNNWKKREEMQQSDLRGMSKFKKEIHPKIRKKIQKMMELEGLKEIIQFSTFI